MLLFPGTTVDITAATVDRVQLPVLDKHQVALSVLRLDKIHPVISGNKWFKLMYYLQAAQQSGAAGLLTFGGAYSNHILAVACAAAELGWKSIGVIRGEQPALLSGTLQEAMRYGMQPEFVSREAYAAKTSEGF